ncbi:transmembrane protein 272-like [Sardina pilchardus]|uniref:transmembrane protein 272-like n=1 Tax=Sardina pilchardus TaxID=27697 RepID=UPI002E0F09C6
MSQKEAIHDILFVGGSMISGRIRILISLIPIVITGLGARHFHECPKEPMVPIFLVVGGSASVTLQLLPFFYCRGPKDVPNMFCRICNFVLYIFCFVWLIIGSVFVYRAYLPDLESRNSEEYCERILYLVTLWFTTGIYIFIVLFIIYMSCKYLCCRS